MNEDRRLAHAVMDVTHYRVALQAILELDPARAPFSVHQIARAALAAAALDPSTRLDEWGEVVDGPPRRGETVTVVDS